MPLATYRSIKPSAHVSARHHCRRFLVSQVRPIRSKTCQISGGGYCSTVALSIASAARKRGWKGGTGGGEALGIAKAVADCIVNRGEKLDGGSGGAETIDISDVTVAPNGFINFAADSVEALPASEVSMSSFTRRAFGSCINAVSWCVIVLDLIQLSTAH